jgi:hypothetical protein
METCLPIEATINNSESKFSKSESATIYGLSTLCPEAAQIWALLQVVRLCTVFRTEMAKRDFGQCTALTPVTANHSNVAL